ncbi:MAG: tRNA (adenosine(37)-N6)-threonylcarbamoyltransferase complex dimerization subunit type 1 TsaB [Christensenellales bacterium]
MKQAGCKNADLTGIAVANGPGSFTGIRIGVAMAKAMAQALSLPILGVCTLDVLACQADKASVRCAVMDARRKKCIAWPIGGKPALCRTAPCRWKFLQHIAQTGNRRALLVTPCAFIGKRSAIHWGKRRSKCRAYVCIRRRVPWPAWRQKSLWRNGKPPLRCSRII